MQVKLEYQGFLLDMSEELNKIGDEFSDLKDKSLRRIGKVLKKSAEKNLSAIRSELEEDGYKHMADDVKSTLKSDKMGNSAIIVGGGKETAYKWHLVDDGTARSDPRHFTDKVMSECKGEIEAEIDDLLKAVANGK